MKIKQKIKQCFCKHEFLPWANIYGDLINAMNCRTIFLCPKCYKRKYSGDLIEAPLSYNEVVKFAYLKDEIGEDKAYEQCKDFLVKNKNLYNRLWSNEVRDVLH